jgi:hypothetical protein
MQGPAENSLRMKFRCFLQRIFHGAEDVPHSPETPIPLFSVSLPSSLHQGNRLRFVSMQRRPSRGSSIRDARVSMVPPPAKAQAPLVMQDTPITKSL